MASRGPPTNVALLEQLEKTPFRAACRLWEVDESWAGKAGPAVGRRGGGAARQRSVQQLELDEVACS